MYMTLIRGLPGSSKSTTARHILYSSRDADRVCMHYEADKYFYRGGEYKFDINQLVEAHDWCRRTTYESLLHGEDVIVSNTFTTIRELTPYFEMAKEFEIIPNVILCQSNFGSIHNVPEEAYKKMQARFVYDLSPLYEKLK